jgi:phage baseplate assembly protein W
MTALRGLAFPFRFDARTGGVRVTEGPEKIRDNLVHILLTDLGERVMRRDWGAGIRQMLHDPVNPVLLSVVRHQVVKAIARAEPRVEVTEVRLEAVRPGAASSRVATQGSEVAGETVVAEIDFVIRRTGQPVSLSVPLGLGVQ